MSTQIVSPSEANTYLASCSGDEMFALSDMVLFFGEEPRDSEPLNVHPLVVIEEPVLPILDSLDWVVQKVMIFCRFVGLSSEGFKDMS